MTSVCNAQQNHHSQYCKQILPRLQAHNCHAHQLAVSTVLPTLHPSKVYTCIYTAIIIPLDPTAVSAQGTSHDNICALNLNLNSENEMYADHRPPAAPYTVTTQPTTWCSTIQVHQFCVMTAAAPS